MLHNNFKIAWRTLKKQWQYSLINITGLAAGMACCILIVLYVRDERSYDQYHHDAARIYRVARIEINNDGQQEPRARTVRAVAFTLRQDLAEVAASATLFQCRQMAMQYNEAQFIETRVFEADSNLFNVFTFPFLKGSPQTSLADPNGVVITASTARKYFGTEEPIGKMIRSEKMDLYVTGVVKDVPANSHFHFDMLIPLRTVEVEHNTQWLGGMNYFTYVKLNEGVVPAAFEANLKTHVKKYNPETRDAYFIQPLTAIHLTSNLKGELEPNGDAADLKIITVIAFFVIITACVNYINLATARATKRAREVGVRKVSGALRHTLMGQFLAEAVLTALLSFITALLMVLALIHPFNEFTGKHFDLLHPDLFTLWTSLAALAIAIGLIAGLYPALFLSSLNPVKVLKGSFTNVSASAGFLRKALVAFQFIISICLIIATIVIVQQTEYILNKDPGFDKEQVIILSNADRLHNREVLEAQIAQLPDVKGVGASTTIIGKPTWTTNIKADPSQNFQLIDFFQIDYGYFDALGIQLQKGRKFSPLFPADTINTIILNETAVKALNLKDPVGQRLIWDEGGPDTTIYATVVGVVRDFHYASFHEPIRPFAFLVRNTFFVHGDFTSKLFIKTDSRHIGNTLQQLEKLWKEHVPQRPFTYEFMDDSFSALHAAEERFKTLFTWLTGLAIFIACLGLSGLTAFVVAQRTKEIGIRKVLGASVGNILVLINKDVMKLIITALIIAAPIAFYFMEQWLLNFAYHVELQWWIVAIAGAVVTVIMIITTGYQSVKASLNNPVESLKVE